MDQYDEEEEEVEPLLKYNRLGNDLKRVLKEDPASCLAVHSKFLVIGSHSGSVHIFDHEGNRITDKQFQSHDITVNQLSIDEKGEYIASCSDDGKAVVNGLFSDEHEQVIEFERPVKAVAIDPQYSKRSRQLVTGDDKLLISEKSAGFFGKHVKRNTIHQGEGIIRSIKWNRSFIAWANSQGVKIYDVRSQQRITSIGFNFQEAVKQRPDLYRCSMCWRDESSLLIGYGDQVRVVQINTRAAHDVRDLPRTYAQITAMFKTDYFIAGIAPSGSNIVLLTYNESEVKKEGKRTINPRPHVRLVVPGMDYSVEKSNDALSIRHYEMYRCDLYGLEWVPNEDTYFIISPIDIIKANPRTEEDHVNWLVKHNKFLEAMSVVQKSETGLKTHTYEKIGHMYLDFLCEQDNFVEAAKRCTSILAHNQESWEHYFYKFRDSGKIQEIALYLPREDPTLQPAVYELVLYHFIQTDIQSFSHLIKTWQKSIYHGPTIINTVLERMKTSDSSLAEEDRHSLYESLAILYTNQSEYAEALTVYLKLKHDDVFEFIHKHNLFSSINSQIVLLMDFNCGLALDLLLNNIECIPPQLVVPQLEKHSLYQFNYLDRLIKRYPYECTSYHNKMVYLYAEHSPKNLLSFLKRADGYDQAAAVKFCDERELLKEKVYLQGKMGNHRQALQSIVHDLQDVEYAIDFCKEHNYKSLWDELITYSLTNPKFITALLENIGTHVDPLILIQRIPEKTEIPNLRNSLVKILQDFNLQISLREDCQKILETDTLNLLAQHVKLQKKGLCVEDAARCSICHERIIPIDLRFGTDMTMFYCHHMFHIDCLPSYSSSTCAICNAQKRNPGYSSSLM